MNKRPGLPLATLLLLAFVIIGGASTLLIRNFIDKRQQEVISQLGLNESQTAAEQIYQHLYSVMRKGWSRAEVDETLARIGAAYPDIRIRLIRSEGVARQYGDDANSQAIRRNDAAVARGIRTGERHYAEHDGVMRYILPLANHADCQTCHNNTLGGINGLIDISIPADKLRTPIEATLKPLLNFATLLVLALFLAIYLLLRHTIVRPITALSGHVNELVADIDHGGRIKVNSAWAREIQLLADQFNHLANEVQDNHRRLTELAVRDKLTGLYNRRYFDEMLISSLNQAERYGQPLCVLMLDLDGFKPVNDQHGHAMGDTVLADVGRLIQSVTRDGDICSRIGGDEFLIIAVNSTLEGAGILAERLSDGIGKLCWKAPMSEAEIHVGVSIGIAVYPEHAKDLSTLLNCADSAMYSNKRQKKDPPASALAA
jgi:diguanylate cyclase (GGDEF)-like protein